MLNNLLSKLTPKHKRWLIIGGFVALGVAVAAVFLMVPYKNKKMELEQLQATLLEKQNQLESKKHSQAKLDEALLDKEKKLVELSRLEKGLPEADYVPTLLTMLEDLSAEVRSKLTSITPSIPTTPQVAAQGSAEAAQAPAAILTYKEMTLSIPFQGTYDNLKLLINRLSQFPMVVVVTSLSISGGTSIDPSEGVPLVSASLPTKIYILPPSGKTSGEAVKPAGT